MLRCLVTLTMTIKQVVLVYL
ncbi:unnamed protein product [Acanthoscelides obtectus]|uniref:Uncharacterized protein n=1 Tax=Acanthoscelides obtectus TaxID=200917 RepID=A0A9P0PL16_ACAOB|nr:unnamed protein product [Acanthoscelides obtectus]CAK1649609.1 hypothetical protein AOBTE_LOCUS16329 [Acanthoscelides obtectus]